MPIHFEIQRAGRVFSATAEGAAAVGVCWDNVDLQGLQKRPYRHDQLALAVHPDHPLAGLPSISFDQTLDYEHVGLPPATAVHTMLQRAAAGAGRTISYRVIVSSFDAAFRVVAAGLGICLVPEVAALSVPAGVATVGVEDPGWPGRMTVAVTRERSGKEAGAVMDALREAGAGIRGDIQRRHGP